MSDNFASFSITSIGIQRFWRRVVKLGNESGCWIWDGTTDKDGYGSFHIRNREGAHGHRAHRISWFLNHGYIPNSLVLHKCDTRLCVRPDHLFLGSHADNVRDKVSKSRQLRGSKSPSAKLSESDVEEIRNMAAGGQKHETLAMAYGISRSVISSIVQRITWKHVGGAICVRKHNRQLATESLKEIRARLAASKRRGDQRKIAREFKIDERLLSAIKTGRKYSAA